MRNGKYSKANQTFADFKNLNRKRNLSAQEHVTELKQFAIIERQLRYPVECGDEKIRSALIQISKLDISTSHPLLLNLFERSLDGSLSNDDLLGCLRDLASFVIRRSICGESTRGYGLWFCEAILSINENPRLDLQQYFIRRGWPDDKSFTKRLVEFPIYRREGKKCRLILETLEESHGHKEKVELSSLQIEHVMPQTISGTSGNAWKTMLGEGWEETHDELIHTIGNLTLTGYNQDLSNKSYDLKHKELIRSNLEINNYFEEVDSWDGLAIRKRADVVATKIAKIWSRPNLGDYVPVEISTKKLTRDAEYNARIEYWRTVIEKLKGNQLITRLPKPSRNGRIGFPLGVSQFKVVAFTLKKENAIGVFLRCMGKNAQKNFGCLLEQRREIEDEIGEVLKWEELPNKQSSMIMLRRPRSNPFDRSDWDQQHEWLIERVVKFIEAFRPRCEGLTGSVSEKERYSIRERFWTELLQRAREQTDLHANISPGRYAWIGTGAGVAGLQYVYSVLQSTNRIELYIDRGKGQTKFNRQTFDKLHKLKDEIESEFGAELSWEPLENKQACRIAFELGGGYRSPEEDWPQIQEKMIENMIRFESVFRGRITKL